MEVKLFEVRDRMTFIPVLALRLGCDNEAERYLFACAGYGLTSSEQQRFVMLQRLSDGETHYFPEEWNSETMRDAHQHLLNYWAQYASGDVICTEFLRGERSTPKTSQRLEDITL